MVLYGGGGKNSIILHWLSSMILGYKLHVQKMHINVLYNIPFLIVLDLQLFLFKRLTTISVKFLQTAKWRFPKMELKYTYVL